MESKWFSIFLLLRLYEQLRNHFFCYILFYQKALVELYLEPSRTSTIKFFHENSQRLKVKNAPS